MSSITQNTGFQRFSLPLLEALDLHCFWARFYDQPQYGYSRHHFSDDTLCCFLQGEGWVRLSGREKVVWQAPCLLLFRKTQAYDAFSPGPIQAHSMHFRCELTGKPPVSLLDLLDVPPLLPAELTDSVAPHLSAMTAEFLDKRLGSQWVLDGQLRLVLAKILRVLWIQAAPAGGLTVGGDSATAAAPAPAPAVPRRGLQRLAPALSWMSAHLADPLTVDQIARQVGLSAGHFTAAFKKTFRITPTQYLIQLRIDRARRLLLTSAMTVNEIAHGLGFAYPHYFIRQFKRATGQTPSAYRTANAQ